jgi:hypothetical protein
MESIRGSIGGPHTGGKYNSEHQFDEADTVTYGLQGVVNEGWGCYDEADTVTYGLKGAMHGGPGCVERVSDMFGTMHVCVRGQVRSGCDVYVVCIVYVCVYAYMWFD